MAISKSNQDGAGLGDLLCFSVYSAGHAFNHLYRSLLADLGLTYPQYLVMAILWAEDNRTVKALGHEMQLESNTLTPLLKRLEALNFITRSRDDLDERVVRVRLTGAGRELKTRAADIPRCVFEATGLNAETLSTLIRSIDAVRDRLIADYGLREGASSHNSPHSTEEPEV